MSSAGRAKCPAGSGNPGNLFGPFSEVADQTLESVDRLVAKMIDAAMKNYPAYRRCDRIEPRIRARGSRLKSARGISTIVLCQSCPRSGSGFVLDDVGGKCLPEIQVDASDHRANSG